MAISKKTEIARVEWYRDVMRKDVASEERRALDMEVQGRRRGRPKIRWTVWPAVVQWNMRALGSEVSPGARVRILSTARV
ncbi:hypothetical protein E2C01_092293 [Portunus trituberculatus]|uniref:Uncharacterized protein n=1 Tax=Portunus trituberculatus TaxID=210409 RepID=A0A5B7JRM5_PORTR|nr:hypothetical protein [Portunus trituberculatus]